MTIGQESGRAAHAATHGLRRAGLGATSTLAVALVAMSLGALVPRVAAAKAPPGEGRVLVATLDGPVSPVMSEALSRTLARGEREGYAAVVFKLDTPGGLESSMRDMVKVLLASRVPTIVWVSPGGAHAASAGVFVTMAADVAAMAPGTNIGAATPINMQGPMDSTLARKVTNDAAAFARTVATQRGRNVVWAERAVREAVAINENEAVEQHVVDFTAATLEEVLAKSDGRTWRRDSTVRTLHTRGLPMDTLEAGFRQRLLSVIADPNIAYILLMLGFYGLLFELQNPGAILPGVVGGISLILAFLALSTLPVNTAGIALIVLAVVFFVAEIKVASHGLLAVGGVLAMLLGSMILYRGDSPRLAWPVILGVTGATALFFLVIVGAGLRAQRRRVTTGSAGLIGRRARVLERLAPAGRVELLGELWNAVADEMVEAGSEVEIVGSDRLTLRVRPVAKEAGS
jgi:membrane-bound serine protease (ClpP class)